MNKAYATSIAKKSGMKTGPYKVKPKQKHGLKLMRSAGLTPGTGSKPKSQANQPFHGPKQTRKERQWEHKLHEGIRGKHIHPHTLARKRFPNTDAIPAPATLQAMINKYKSNKRNANKAHIKAINKKIHHLRKEIQKERNKNPGHGDPRETHIA